MLSPADAMTREQVAQLLQVSLRTLKTWHKTGVLVGHPIGPKLMRYDRATVERFVLNRELSTSATTNNEVA